MNSREFKLMIALFSFAVCIMFFVVYKNEPFFNTINYSKSVFILEKENDSLKKEIAFDRFVISQYQYRIDSLEKLKPEIIIKYVQKNKSIDNGTVNELINEYKGIFTKSNIK